MAQRKKAICFSAGHGLSSRIKGHTDPGASGYGANEAKRNLWMCSNLAKDFAALGWSVLLRDSGYYATADDDAYKWGASTFIEYHLNAAGKAASGTECWVASRPSSTEKSIGTSIVKRIAAVGFRNRGLKTTNQLAVLKKHIGMASILVEACFITNKGDMERYNNNVEKVELAVVNGILTGRGFKPVKKLPRKMNGVSRLFAKIVRR